MRTPPVTNRPLPPLSEEDILRGMEALRGYVDLTPQDFRVLYANVHALAYERLLRERTAADIMTSPVVTVRESSSVGECIGLLAEREISGAPVVDARGIIVGIVSEKDILRLLGRRPETHLMRLIDDSIRQPLQPSPVLLRAGIAVIMSAPVVAAGPETTLGELARIFGSHAINRLPVTDGHGMVLGIITRADMIRAISELA